MVPNGLRIALRRVHKYQDALELTRLLRIEFDRNGAGPEQTSMPLHWLLVIENGQSAHCYIF
jgi:hypothetical protein